MIARPESTDGRSGSNGSSSQGWSVLAGEERTQEVLSLVEWTRRQNINKDPIVFRGIDMQSADKAQGLLHTTLNKDATAQQLQEEIRPKLGQIRTYNFVGSARIGPLQACEIRQDLNRFKTASKR